MGTYNKGILGPFRGTVGPVVGSTFRGKDVMRSRPRKTNRAATVLQLQQRAKFRTVTQFLTPVRVLVSEYFGAPVESRSRYNMATSYHIKEAVNYANDVATIIYDKVVYAKGNLLPLQNLVATPEENAVINLTWVDNSGQAGTDPKDELMIVVVEMNVDDYHLFLNGATRESASETITLPAYLRGTTVHVYAFVVSENGKVNSTSQHLGRFEVL